MNYWEERSPELRSERHFGRELRCFASRPAGLPELLEAAASRNPGGEALVFADTRLDWEALRLRVASTAGALVETGVVAGDRVAILLGNGLDFPLAFLGASWAGAIPVPIGIRERGPGLAYILGHCSARLVIHEEELAERLPRAPIRITAEDLAELSRAARPLPARSSDEEATAALLYTSGTTGRPKGAMLTHLGIVHSALNYAACMGLNEASRLVAAVPLSHVTGVVALLAATLRCAGTLIVQRAFQADAFLELAARERMSHTVLVPAMYNLCLLDPYFERHDLSAWRLGAYGGAPMPASTIGALAEKLPRLALMNAYGATETTSPATLMPPEETAARGDSVGLAVPGADIRVVDDELWIRGPMVVKGYWEDAEATSREFSDGFWRSGDVGSVDAEGFVRVLDRKKDMINRGGYKVFSAEVENVLMQHPSVVEAAVVGRPCPVLGERVQAFVTTREPVSPHALHSFCAERLADYKVPESFTLSPDPLPRNANGKVLKRDLRLRVSEGRER